MAVPDRNCASRVLAAAYAKQVRLRRKTLASGILALATEDAVAEPPRGSEARLARDVLSQPVRGAS